MRYFSVDPGVTTAWASFADATLGETDELPGLDPDTAVEMWLEHMVGIDPPEQVVIEVIDPWLRDGKNMAALLTEDRIAHVLIGMWRTQGIPVRRILVSEWKGRTPKSVTQFHVGIEFPGLDISNHQADAVALGRWWWIQRAFDQKLNALKSMMYGGQMRRVTP